MTEVAWTPPPDEPQMFDNDVICIIEASKFVVTTPIPRFAVRPVIMPPLPRSA